MPRKMSPREALDKSRKSKANDLFQISTRINKNLWEAIADYALKNDMDDMSSAYRRALEAWASNLQGVTGPPIDQVENEDLIREIKKRGFLVLTAKDFEKIIDRQLKDLKRSVQDSLTESLSAKALSQMASQATEDVE